MFPWTDQSEPQENSRACLGCGLILSDNVWKQIITCPNCKFLQPYKDFTSTDFTGYAVRSEDAINENNFNPETSQIPGWYCDHINGEVSQEIINHLKSKQLKMPTWISNS